MTSNSSASKRARILVSIVTYNHQSTIKATLESLQRIIREPNEFELLVRVIDNQSTDDTVKELTLFSKMPEVTLVENIKNVGFCAAHNANVDFFMHSGLDYFLILNPDIYITTDAISQMIRSFELSPLIGAVTPKILRCASDLSPIIPPTIDACGMKLTSQLRHLDRGSGEIDIGTYNTPGYVFGGTGACLFLNRAFIMDLAIPRSLTRAGLDEVYPEYDSINQPRYEIFDPSFFAYREDADLSWRANLLGWRYFYQPNAIIYHVRKVVPENRSSLPAILNRLSVKNRFLLLLNNYSSRSCRNAFLRGMLIRNILVVLGVILKEHRSLPAFLDFAKLCSRSLAIRRYVSSRLNGSVTCED